MGDTAFCLKLFVVFFSFVGFVGFLYVLPAVVFFLSTKRGASLRWQHYSVVVVDVM